MQAVYLCHFCPFSPSIDREPQKSFYIFLPSIVSPCSSNPLQSCTWARPYIVSIYSACLCSPTMSKRRNSLCMFFAPFVVLLCSARPCQSSFALQPLKVSTHHARPHRVSIWFAHLCSPYTIKSARVSPIFCHPCSPLILRAPLQSSFALQPLKVSTHHARPYIVFI